MTKQRRNALMMFALTLLYAAWQNHRTAEQITPISKMLSLLIPIVAIIFALNEKSPGLRWTLIACEVLLALFMLFIALNS